MILNIITTSLGLQPALLFRWTVKSLESNKSRNISKFITLNMRSRGLPLDDNFDKFSCSSNNPYYLPTYSIA